jgi:hypothetical protein
MKVLFEIRLVVSRHTHIQCRFIVDFKGLMEDKRLAFFKDRVPKKTLGTKREGAVGGW